MDLRTEIAAALQKIDIAPELGLSPDVAADIIVKPAAEQLFSDNIQRYIDERVAALEMHAQKLGHRQTARTPHIHAAIEPIIRASSYAQRQRP